MTTHLLESFLISTIGCLVGLLHKGKQAILEQMAIFMVVTTFKGNVLVVQGLSLDGIMVDQIYGF